MGEPKLAGSVDSAGLDTVRMAALPLVDTEVTNELRELAGDVPDFLDELLGLYKTKSVEDFDAMRRALRELDGAGLARAAHSLKGASGNLGARRLEALCGRIEVLARSAAFLSVEPLVREAADCFAQTQTALNEAFAKR